VKTGSQGFKSLVLEYWEAVRCLLRERLLLARFYKSIPCCSRDMNTIARPEHHDIHDVGGGKST